MKNYDKILELIQKDNLSQEEKDLLSSIIADDDNAKEFYETYRKIQNSANYSGHISTETLGSYILLKNGLQPEGHWNAQKINQIETHLKECGSCSKEFLELSEEYSDIKNFLSGQLNSEDKGIQNTAYKRQLFFSKYIFLSLLLLGFLYFGLYLISGFTTPPLKKLAAFNDNSEFSISRGRASDNFQNSLKDLENGNYQSAVNYLNLDIKNNGNDETIFYSYFVLGLTHLKLAGSNFLGLFPSYNKSEAGKALDSFKKTIEMNKSDKYPNISMDAYFYSAKACLMLNNKSGAEKYLKIVIKLKGSKMNQAKVLLEELE